MCLMIYWVSFVALSSLAHATEIKTVVFDCGGVIVDVDQSQLINFVSNTFTIHPKEAMGILQNLKLCLINGGDEKEFWTTYASGRAKKLSNKWFALWEQAKLKAVKEIPNSIKVVQALQRMGYQTAMLSNAWEYQAVTIRKLGYFDFFYPVLLSYEIGIEKPDLKAYTILLRELNLAPDECLFIDDRAENVEAARSLGIDSIQFINVPQLIEELNQRRIIFDCEAVQK
jgi:putative hydrolase of the HAD superfamily